MEKHAYLLITDLHDVGHLKMNRQDYASEINEIKRKILDLVLEYKDKGFVPTVIFMGDIFDRGYKHSVFKAVNDNNYFVVLRQQCEVFALMGNHEFSFYNDNPFYTLITEIESEKVKQRQNRVWTPQGALPLLRVVDNIVDGDLVIHFNHNETPISGAIQGKHNVALFHQEIICRDILQAAEKEFRASIFTKRTLRSFDNTDLFDGFDAAFFGHLHKVYGTWVYQKTENSNPCDLVYLASLGRPAQDEVNNNLLERTIPALLVEDGHYVGYENNLLTLRAREDSVKEEEVVIQQELYKRAKARHDQLSIDYGDYDIIDGIRHRCMSPVQRSIVDEILEYGSSAICERLLNETRRKFGGV